MKKTLLLTLALLLVCASIAVSGETVKAASRFICFLSDDHNGPAIYSFVRLDASGHSSKQTPHEERLVIKTPGSNQLELIAVLGGIYTVNGARFTSAVDGAVSYVFWVSRPSGNEEYTYSLGDRILRRVK